MPNTIITKHSTGVFSVNNGTIQKIDGSFGATTEGTLISIKGRNGQVLYQDITVGGAGDRLLINDLTTTINYDPATTLEAMTTLYAIGFFVEAAVVAAGTFAGLLDTSIVAPANGQLPFYNSATSRWTNRLAVINDITEFNVTAPVINDVLQWNGTDFVNRQSLFINESEAVNFGAVGSLFNSANFVNLDIEQLGGIFRVRNNVDTELFSIENDNGNAFLRVGSMYITSGGLSVSSSLVANGVSAINADLYIDGELDITSGSINLDDSFGIFWAPSGNYITNTSGVLYLFSTDDVVIEAEDDVIISAAANVIIDAEFVVNDNSYFLANIQCNGKIRVADSAVAPVAGDIRYNNGAGRHEGYNGVSWQAMY
jgi:hypothetical protein